MIIGLSHYNVDDHKNRKGHWNLMEQSICKVDHGSLLLDLVVDLYGLVQCMCNFMIVPRPKGMLIFIILTFFMI